MVGKQVWAFVGAGLGVWISASDAAAQTRPEDTEVWKPLVPVVAPGTVSGAAPSDAIILFDGRDLDQWVTAADKSPAGWTVADGVITVDKARGNIETKRTFRDYQLHLEWRVPADIAGSGQARGNSGVFLASTGSRDQGYEVQILDSYQSSTYVNGQAGAVYKQHPPLANANRKPGEWQTYDIIWRAPVFGPDGVLTRAASVTVLHNGVLVQDNAVLAGETVYIGKPGYKAHGPSPIKLQAHGDPSAPISFRNIWVRELAPR
ncbi:MAG: 3-keto-disaccharide hydrolase [Caulobacter sp.]